jgi:alpha-ketoglutaric semialdehyde dehydrogenase
MTFTSVNPHDPADVVGEWESATERDVAAAVDRACRSAQTWRRAPGPARAAALGQAAAALERRAAEVTALTVREVGKPVSEARGEVARAVSILRYYSQLALLPDGETLPAADPDALLMARYRPVGVTALLTPWNFPVAIPLWKAAPSLAYGNATILKPSSAAAATALLLHEIIAPELPDGVFQVLLGGAGTARPLIEPGGRARRQDPGRDGRAEPVDRARRRGPGPGGLHDRVRGDGVRGPEVHGDEPGDRREAGVRGVP